MMTADPIVAFYSGGVDDRGRTLQSILEWSDERLESVHDYIQWMFPTTTPSGVNPWAPLVTAVTIVAFKSPAMRDRLRRALDRMLMFYGLTRAADSTGRVTTAIDPERFDRRAIDWLTPGNHNHLRLTRIMQSLWALGLREEAAALQRCLVSDIYEGPGANRITRETIAFWRTALPRDHS
jgi:hypothetical protein